MIDYFKESEKLLTELPFLKQAVENLHTRKAALSKIAAEPQQTGSRKHKGAFDDNEQIWLDCRLTEKQIKNTSIIIDAIEQTLAQLDSEERIILRLWYIKHESKEQILERMHYESMTSLYNIKNKAVRRFTLLYYGV